MVGKGLLVKFVSVHLLMVLKKCHLGLYAPRMLHDYVGTPMFIQ